MSDNRGIDAVDTLLGGMGSMFGRVLLWFGTMWACIIIGVIGITLHELIIGMMEGYSPVDMLGTLPWGEMLKGIVLLPFAWVWMCILCFGHWIGLIYLPLVVVGTWMFLATEQWEEELFFLNVILSPLATLVFWRDGFPWGALPVFLSWSVLWGWLWWVRSRSGSAADFREKELKEAFGRNYSLVNFNPIVEPTAVNEFQPPPPPVNVSIPKPGAAPRQPPAAASE